MRVLDEEALSSGRSQPEDFNSSPLHIEADRYILCYWHLLWVVCIDNIMNILLFYLKYLEDFRGPVAILSQLAEGIVPYPEDMDVRTDLSAVIRWVGLGLCAAELNAL